MQLSFKGGAGAKWCKALLEGEKINQNQKRYPAWAIFKNYPIVPHGPSISRPLIFRRNAASAKRH